VRSTVALEATPLQTTCEWMGSPRDGPSKEIESEVGNLKEFSDSFKVLLRGDLVQ